PLTCKHYRRDQEQLNRYREEQALMHWRELDAQHVRAFVAGRHRAGLSGRSIQRLLSATRSFYAYLIREGEASYDPAGDVSAPKSASKLPKVLDVDAMAALLETDGDDALLLRDRAIFELIYSSGLRLAETAQLNLVDID